MGHGMAKNLLAKGYALTLQGAPQPRSAGRPARRRRARRRRPRRRRARLRHRDPLRRPARRRSRRSSTAHDGLLEAARAGPDRRSTPRPPSRRRARASAPTSPRAARASSTRRWRARRRRPRKDASTRWSAPTRPTSQVVEPVLAGVLREHLPRRPARARPCAQADQQHAGDDDRRGDRRGGRGRGQDRAVAGTSCSTWSRAGGVNSGIFQMMVGQMLQGDLAGLKFAIANGAEGPALLHPPDRGAAGAELHRRGRAPELRAGRQPRPSATSSSPRCSRRRSSQRREDRAALNPSHRPPTETSHERRRDPQPSLCTDVGPGRCSAPASYGVAPFFGPWTHNRVWAQSAQKKPLVIGLTMDASRPVRAPAAARSGWAR